MDEDRMARMESELPEDCYDPDQDEEERRRIRSNLRENAREFQNRRDELMRPENNDILAILDRQEDLARQVRQTADAALDSRFLVAASDLTLRKTKQMTLGSGAVTGIDLDELVGKVAALMRRPDAAAEQAAPDMDSASLGWHAFGAQVCLPSISRAPAPSHLLGPLSIQKRVRMAPVRRAPRAAASGAISKPEELTARDLTQNENSDTPTLCRNIRQILNEIFTEGFRKAEPVDLESMPEEEAIAFLDECQLASDYQVPLLKFALNPRSFGQTVENLFYISFIVKDGAAALGRDMDGLPTIRPVQPTTTEDRAQAIKAGATLERHQVIFSLDWSTWRKLVDLYQLDKPWIPHREYEQTSSVRGWYG